MQYCLDEGYWASFGMEIHKWAGIVFNGSDYHWYGNCQETISGNFIGLDLTQCAIPVIPGCFDSDGGNNTYIKGRTGETEDGPYFDEDFCMKDGDENDPSRAQALR